MAGQTGWGFFGGKGDSTSENKVDKNAKKIQDFINKYKIRSRDLNVPSEVAKDQGSYAPGWQSFAWLEEATVTSNNRTTRYKEYREMIRIPELNQSINIYADNGTQFNVQKNVMEIGSDNNKIIEIVDKLMFENLDMNSNLWSIVRNTCKLGDEFLEVIVDNVDNPKHIISLERIKKPENMKRVEREGNLIEFRYEYEDEEKENRVFQPWQIVHFRIEDEEFEPYGRSILESGRKTFKKLSLMEDAMLIYRISRAPERRVFYVDVGTMPTKEANKFMETLKRQFRKKKFINPTTGEVDEKANPLCITLDTKIPLLDGRSLSLTELIEEYKSGNENWTYSIDVENDNQIVPGKIIWADVTRKNAKLIKVTLDNGEELRTTPDHRFMLRDGSYCEAQDLKNGQALMPFYTKLSSKEDRDKIDGYEKIYNPKTSKYEYTHRLVGNMYDDWKNRKFTSFNNNKTIHHKDFNKLNNTPNNLKVMSFSNHRKLHQNMSYIYNDIRSKNMKKQFSDPKLRQKYINGMTIRNKVTNKFWSLLKNIAQETQPNSQGYISIVNVMENACNNNKLMQEWKTFCKPNKQVNGPNAHFIVKAMREIGYESSEQWLKEVCGVKTKSLRTPNTKLATQKFQEKMKKKEEETLLVIDQHFTKNAIIYSHEITNFCKENGFLYTYIKNVLIRNNYNVLSSITQRLDNIETICLDKASEYNKMQDFILQEEISRKQYYNILNKLSLKSWKELRLLSKQSNYQNHKVTKIEWLDYKEDTGDITIEKYHNFATEAGVFVHNSVDEDFYIPVRQNSQGTRIETLPGGQNLGEIDDVKYFKDQILRTMGIPTGYLGGNSSDAGAGTYDPKSYLSNQEVQFSRTIERIQKLIIKGLEKIALIELVFSKIDSKEIRDFKIKLTPPSNVDQLMEIEIRNQQFALIQQVRTLENFLPDEWIYKEILGMSEQEIQKIRLQIQMQMQMQLQMQNLGASAGGGMDMAGGGNLGGNIMGGGASGGAAGGPPEGGMGGQEAPAGGEAPPAGGGEAGLEVAGANFIEFDGGKWLFESNKDVEKLLKYVNLYEKVHKDNNSDKIKYEQKNSATRMIIEGEFRGLLKAYRSSNKIQRTLNEKVKMSK